MTTICHPIEDKLETAASRLREDAAPGLDGVRLGQYLKTLPLYLPRLIQKLRDGTWEPRPVLRKEIPKDKAEKRNLGLPRVEDKHVQMAIHLNLGPGWEALFTGDSFGYRQGIGTLNACRKIKTILTQWGGAWVLDADIKGFFDNLVHAKLMDMLKQVGVSKHERRLIYKMLKAGVVTGKGKVEATRKGTPQGGVNSPGLSNLYLHVVLDSWVPTHLRPEVGEVVLVRYADDFVMLFRSEASARKAWSMVCQRLREYGLELHGEKTRIIDCHPDAVETKCTEWHPGRKTSFHFLGFTFSMEETGKSARARVRVITSTPSIKKACHRWEAYALSHEFKDLTADGLVKKFKNSVGGFLAYQDRLSEREGMVAYLKAVEPVLQDLLKLKADVQPRHAQSLSRMLVPENIPTLIEHARLLARLHFWRVGKKTSGRIAPDLQTVWTTPCTGARELDPTA